MVQDTSFHPQGPCEGGIMAHSPRPDPLKQRCPAEQQQYLGGVCSKGSLVHRAFSIRIRDARWQLIGEPVLPLARIIVREHVRRAGVPASAKAPRLVSRTHADDAPAIQQFNLCSMAHAFAKLRYLGTLEGRSAALESCSVDQICCRHRRSGI